MIYFIFLESASQFAIYRIYGDILKDAFKPL